MQEDEYMDASNETIADIPPLDERNVELWNAIHEYARLSYTGFELGPSVGRQKAVVRVNSAVRALLEAFARHLPAAELRIHQEETARLRKLESLLQDSFMPVLEMDNEANDPSTQLFIDMHVAKILLDRKP